MSKNRVLSWQEVANSDGFKQLDAAQRVALRQEYFDQVVAPALNSRGLDLQAGWDLFKDRAQLPEPPGMSPREIERKAGLLANETSQGAPARNPFQAPEQPAPSAEQALASAWQSLSKDQRQHIESAALVARADGQDVEAYKNRKALELYADNLRAAEEAQRKATPVSAAKAAGHMAAAIPSGIGRATYGALALAADQLGADGVTAWAVERVRAIEAGNRALDQSGAIDSKLGRDVYQGVVSAAEQLPAMAMSVAAPELAPAIMGGYGATAQGTASYADAREAGHGKGTSLAIGAAQGAAEGLGDAIGARIVTGAIGRGAGSKGIVGKMLAASQSVGGEAVQEGVTQIAQSAVEQAHGLNGREAGNWSEYAERLPDEIQSAAIGGMVGGSIFHGAGAVANRLQRPNQVMTPAPVVESALGNPAAPDLPTASTLDTTNMDPRAAFEAIAAAPVAEVAPIIPSPAVAPVAYADPTRPTMEDIGLEEAAPIDRIGVNETGSEVGSRIDGSGSGAPGIIGALLQPGGAAPVGASPVVATPDLSAPEPVAAGEPPAAAPLGAPPAQAAPEAARPVDAPRARAKRGEATPPPPKAGEQIVDVDGDTWRVLGQGATDAEGRVLMHLASTTRGNMQRNGVNPLQMATHVDPSQIRTYEPATPAPAPVKRSQKRGGIVARLIAPPADELGNDWSESEQEAASYNPAEFRDYLTKQPLEFLRQRLEVHRDELADAEQNGGPEAVRAVARDRIGATQAQIALAEAQNQTVDTNNPAAVQAQVAKSKQRRLPKADSSTDSALEFLAKQGGLDPADPLANDLRASIGVDPGKNHRVAPFRFLFAGKGKGGMSVDKAAELLWQHGYMTENDAVGLVDRLFDGDFHSINRSQPSERPDAPPMDDAEGMGRPTQEDPLGLSEADLLEIATGLPQDQEQAVANMMASIDNLLTPERLSALREEFFNEYGAQYEDATFAEYEAAFAEFAARTGRQQLLGAGNAGSEGSRQGTDAAGLGGDRQADREGGEQAASFELNGQTPAELAQASKAQQAREKADAAEAARLEKQARDEREAKEIADRQDASAENFQLGQSAEDSLAGQNDLFSAPAPAKPKAAAEKPVQRGYDYGASNKLVTVDRAAELRAKLKAKLNQLNSGIDPEMLAMGAELATFHIEAGVRRFADFARTMAQDLDVELSKIRPYLRGWYNGARDMIEDAGQDVDGMDSPEQVRAEMASLFQQEQGNAPSSKRDLEQDRGNADAGQSGDEDAIRNERGGNERGAGSAVSGTDGARDPEQGDSGVPDARPAAGGERGNQRVRDAGGEFSAAPGAARGGDNGRGNGGSSERVPTDEGRAERAAADAAPAGSDSTLGRADRRLAADRIAVEPADLDNIRATLPLLLPEQQEDVHKAEIRFQTAHGMLFTNGTGTGKTYTGIGVAKRFARQGKDSILIVAPSQDILKGWIAAGADVGLQIRALESTKDNGAGIVATTYANLGANRTLADRQWDLVIADESHKLMQSEDGRSTSALATLRAITNHPGARHSKARLLMRDALAEQEKLKDELDMLDRLASNGELREDGRIEKLRAKWEALSSKNAAREEALVADIAKQPRTKVTFLSATPFGYHFTLDYADGYLFDYSNGQPDESQEYRSYNSGSNRDRFFMMNFGYRMRYNKLTRPKAGVNVELMERDFHEVLKREGALSGRKLTVDADYDRKFVLVDSGIGQRIDEALEFLRNAKGADEKPKYQELYDFTRKRFDFLSRMRLLEAIKAEHSVEIIRQHMALGRKVVVFHDYNQGGGFSPFDYSTLVAPVVEAERVESSDESEGAEDLRAANDAARSDAAAAEAMLQQQETREKILQQIAELRAERPDILTIDFKDMRSPIVTLKRAFPNVLLYNGTVSGKDRAAARAAFNQDGSGADLILIQSAAGEAGISLHDTTGKHQRTLINLGMPTRPVSAIQIEGRIYRVGQVSDAVLRYLTTGTGWESSTFAMKIAGRAGTAENLAMGNQARALRQSFIDAYNMADEYPASQDDGKGGKQLDGAENSAASPFDRAKTYYYAQQKNTKRRDQREGNDYFATAEPLGFKMVEWADPRPFERMCEPSAGHGAIARFFPENTARTLVEPSGKLGPRAAMASPGAKLIESDFESLSLQNKFDAIVMNPPYGTGGKLAIEHVDKAAKHMRNGGRIVALIPSEGTAQKRWDSWYEGIENLYLLGEVKLPRVAFENAGTSVATKIVILERQNNKNDAAKLRDYKRIDLSNAETVEALFDRIADIGMPERLTPSEPEGLSLVEGDVLAIGGIDMEVAPEFTLIPKGKLDKADFADAAKLAEQYGGRWEREERGFRFASAEKMNSWAEAFDRGDEPKDAKTLREESRARGLAEEAAAAKARRERGRAEAEGAGVPGDIPGATPAKHTTGKGKELSGWVVELSQAEAKAIDPFTFKRDGGYFVRDKHEAALRAKMGGAGGVRQERAAVEWAGVKADAERERIFSRFERLPDGGYSNNDELELMPAGEYSNGASAFRIKHKGATVGFTIVKVNGDGFSALHQIQIDSDKRGSGLGERVIKGILASTDGRLDVVDIVNGHDGQADSRGFWKNIGTKWKNYSGDATQMDGTLQWSDYAQARITNDAAGAGSLAAGVNRQGGAEEDGSGAKGEAPAGGIEVEEVSLEEFYRLAGIDPEEADPYDNEQLQTREGTAGRQMDAGRQALAALEQSAARDALGLRGRARALGVRLSRDFRAGGGTNLVGQRVSSARDLALVAQTLRDPRFETFRAFFVDDSGRVLGSSAYSSRLPGAVYISDLDAHIRAGLSAFGASGYWLLHNHPNGRAKPSRADENQTYAIANDVPGFKGHVIIDFNEYAVISSDDAGMVKSEVVDAPDLASVDFNANPHTAHPLLGKRLDDPRVTADMAKSLQIPDGYLVVAALTASGEIQALAELPSADVQEGMSERERLVQLAALRKLRKNSGASGGLVAITPDDPDARQYRGLRMSGLFDEVVSIDGAVAADMPKNADGTKALGNPEVATRSERTGSVRGWLSSDAVGGAPFNPVTANSPAFRRWFADSIATLDGRTQQQGGAPRVLYHGTSADFNAFNTPVAWVSAKPELASMYARAKGVMSRGGANVMPVYARVERPLDVEKGRMTIGEFIAYAQQQADATGLQYNKSDALKAKSKAIAHWRESGQLEKPMEVHNHWDGGLTGSDLLRGYIQALGFDSMRFDEAGTETFGVFSPAQLKSASGNDGGFDPDNASVVRQTRAAGSIAKPANAAKFSPSAETWLDRALLAIQDRFRPFKRLQEDLEAAGGTVGERQDVVAAEERFHGRAAAQLEDFKDKIVKPLFERMAKHQLSDADVSEFLHALHAEERNEAVAKINPDRKDGGSGMTTGDAEKILAKWRDDPRYIDLQEIAYGWQQIADRRLSVLEEGGIMSADDVERLRSIYQNYVPLKGDVANKDGSIGKGYSVRSKQKRALGHGERDELILENLLRDYESAVLLAEKNRVGQYLLSLIHTNRGQLGALATINKPDKHNRLREWSTYAVVEDTPGGPRVSVEFASVDEALGFIDSQVRSGRDRKAFQVMEETQAKVYRAANSMLEPHEVQVYWEGRPIRITFRDEHNRLAAAYKNMEATTFSTLLNVGLSINRWLSRAYTGWNPEFLFTNMRRDFTSGVINLTAKQGAGVMAKAVKHYGGAVRALMQHGSKGDGKGEWPRWIRQYRELGGQTGAAWLGDLERYHQSIQLLQMEAKRSKLHPFKLGARGVELMEHLNAAGENAFRLATFRAMVESGKTPNEAASMARNVTVNFNRRGNWANATGAMYLFFNANVQGTAAIIDALKNGEHRGQAWALLGGLATLGFLAASLAGALDDDDDEWKTLPDTLKSRNLILPGMGDKHLLIPLPFGHGVAVQMGYMLADVAGGRSVEDVGWGAAVAAFEHFSPVGNPLNDERNSKGVINVLPTMAANLIRPGVNVSGFGGDMYPDYGPSDTRPDDQRSWRATRGTMYATLASAPSKLMGTEYEDNWYDTSPETLKYWWSTLAGGSGRFFTDSASLIAEAVGGAANDDFEGRIELENIPIARTFARESGIRDQRTRFYRDQRPAAEALAAYKRASKAGDGDAMDELQRERGQLIALGTMLGGIRKQAKLVRDEQDRILEDEAIPLGKRRLMVRELEGEEARVYQEFFRELKAAGE